MTINKIIINYFRILSSHLGGCCLQLLPLLQAPDDRHHSGPLLANTNMRIYHCSPVVHRSVRESPASTCCRAKHSRHHQLRDLQLLAGKANHSANFEARRQVSNIPICPDRLCKLLQPAAYFVLTWFLIVLFNKIFLFCISVLAERDGCCEEHRRGRQLQNRQLELATAGGLLDARSLPRALLRRWIRGVDVFRVYVRGNWLHDVHAILALPDVLLAAHQISPEQPFRRSPADSRVALSHLYDWIHAVQTQQCAEKRIQAQPAVEKSVTLGDDSDWTRQTTDRVWAVGHRETSKLLGRLDNAVVTGRGAVQAQFVHLLPGARVNPRSRLSGNQGQQAMSGALRPSMGRVLLPS